MSGARFSVPPAAVRVLAVLVGIQALRTVLPHEYDAYLLFFMAFHPFAGPELDPVWLYGAFTSVFIHANWPHLLMNGLWVVALSSQLRTHLEGARFLVFFAVSGAFGALAHAALNWGTPGILLGSSGAVFGLLGAGAHALLRGSDGRSRPEPQHYVQYILLMMIINLGYAILSEYRISWEAHAGGFFAGLALFPLLRSRPLPAAPQP